VLKGVVKEWGYKPTRNIWQDRVKEWGKRRCKNGKNPQKTD